MMKALVGGLQVRGRQRMAITATMRNGLHAVLAFMALLLVPGLAAAEQPRPWEMNLQPAASPIAEMIHRFNNGLLIVVTLIVLFVLVLLLYCIIRFNARSNPVPSKVSHNTLIE